MNILIKVNTSGDRQTVSARSLWEWLDRPYTEFKKWFDKFSNYGFKEGQDFEALRVKIRTAQGNEMDVSDYQVTVGMAKELCMLQRSDKGKQARLYFLELEKKMNSPEFIMARGLQIADKLIAQLSEEKLIAESKVKVPR